jgi:hypothetical protein
MTKLIIIFRNFVKASKNEEGEERRGGGGISHVWGENIFFVGEI